MGIFHTPALKVGILVVTVLGVIAMMTLSVTEDPTRFGRSTRAWFELDDASGIVKTSNVKMAGIPVGIIKDIKLWKGRARLELILDPDVKLTKTSRIIIRNTGILGDRYVEVIRGVDASGPLEDDGQIVDVRTSGAMDNVMDEVGKLTKSLTDVAQTLKTAATGEGDRNVPLARIIDNIEKLTANLSDLSEVNRDKFDDIVSNIKEVSENLRKAADEGNLKKIDRTLANIEEITDKVNQGKGTIGKLVNDEKTIEELNTAIGGVSKMLDSASRIQTAIDIKSEYLTNHNIYKTYLGLRIKPGLDRYYELQIVDDPRGVVQHTSTTTTANVGTPGETATTTGEVKTFKDQIKFSALFAKNFYDWTLKGGLIESSGGFGFDYFLMKHNLRLSMEAFNYQQDDGFHLRASARYNVLHGVYLSGGADDFASRHGNFSTYIGAGLDFTNDDLKLMLTKVPF